MALLEIFDVSKRFGDIVAVDDVSLSIAAGEIISLLGPSGCGKTTLLRCVAGLERPDEGRIIFDGVDVSELPAYQRGFGMMFQNFALFDHMNVFDNVAYGLRTLGHSRAEAAKRVREMLALVDLTGTEQRRIGQLSGGQQQRVALARALAVEPRLLMLDEPLGSLDRALRERLMIELRVILKQVGVTAIYVTHDQAEAFAVSDRMALMDAGRIVQLDTPRQIYERPASPFAARFLGFANVLAAERLGPGQVDTEIGPLTVAIDGCGERCHVLIRPTALQAASTVNRFEATVMALSFRGRYVELHVQIANRRLEFELDVDPGWQLGHTVSLSLDPAAIITL